MALWRRFGFYATADSPERSHRSTFQLSPTVTELDSALTGIRRDAASGCAGPPWQLLVWPGGRVGALRGDGVARHRLERGRAAANGARSGRTRAPPGGGVRWCYLPGRRHLWRPVLRTRRCHQQHPPPGDRPPRWPEGRAVTSWRTCDRRSDLLHVVWVSSRPPPPSGSASPAMTPGSLPPAASSGRSPRRSHTRKRVHDAGRPIDRTVTRWDRIPPQWSGGRPGAQAGTTRRPQTGPPQPVERLSIPVDG